MRLLPRHWPKLALIIAYTVVLYALVRVEHIEEEGVELWDIHLMEYFKLTYLYDEIEGPVIWLTGENGTRLRWPEADYTPRPTPTPEWLWSA